MGIEGAQTAAAVGFSGRGGCWVEGASSIVEPALGRLAAAVDDAGGVHAFTTEHEARDEGDSGSGRGNGTWAGQERQDEGRDEPAGNVPLVDASVPQLWRGSRWAGWGPLRWQ